MKTILPAQRFPSTLLWLFFAVMCWTHMSPEASDEFLRIGYKVVAAFVVVIVFIDVVSNIYFWYTDKKLHAAIAAKGNGA